MIFPWFFHFYKFQALFIKFNDFSMILKQIWISMIFQELWEPWLSNPRSWRAQCQQYFLLKTKNPNFNHFFYIHVLCPVSVSSDSHTSHQFQSFVSVLLNHICGLSGQMARWSLKWHVDDLAMNRKVYFATEQISCIWLKCYSDFIALGYKIYALIGLFRNNSLMFNNMGRNLSQHESTPLTVHVILL